MARDGFTKASILMTGLLALGVTCAYLVHAKRERATEHQRLAALDAAYESQQPPDFEWTVWHLTEDSRALPLMLDFRRDEPVPDHPFIVPVRPEADAWIRELRVPVTEEERARWVPHEFDGIEYSFAPLQRQ